MNIKEIARQAQVSVATVSRVLNHPEQVQPETREHVLAVMEQFHYTPNWFARGLNLGRTNTVALLVPTFEPVSYTHLIPANDCAFWKVQAIPARQPSPGPSLVMSRSLTRIVPLSILLKPEIDLNLSLIHISSSLVPLTPSST